MPFQPTESLLNLKMEKMHTIDTRSVEDLHGLWLVFHKASKVLEDGPRLENMSWRLWNRETFCCSPANGPSARDQNASREFLPRKKSAQRVPDLARSIDTISSDEDESATGATDEVSQTDVVRPELRRLDSHDTNRTQKHISPVDFEKIVVSIKHTREIEPIDDLTIPALSTCFEDKLKLDSDMASSDGNISQPANDDTPATELEASLEASLEKQDLPFGILGTDSALTITTSNTTDTSPDETDSSSNTMSTHNIVRGFVPGGAPSSYRSQTTLATQPAPILENSNRNMGPPPKRKAAEFTLGGSSAEEESSLESHTFKNSVSSLSERLHRKQASFRDDNLVSKIQDSPVFESDDEDDDDDDDDVSDGAIDDDDDEEDSSEWEDELGDEDGSDTEEAPTFHKVDSRPNLTSHRSLLTSLMHQGDRASALQNAASRSVPALRRTQTTPPQESSRGVSPVARERNGPDGQGSSAHPIAMTASKQYAHLALSPRTTRRNMLQSELTESLRKHLLWERQHKNTTNTALKRRHTTHDIKNLRQLPEVPHMSNNENNTQFNNDYFHAGLGEYHSKGW